VLTQLARIEETTPQQALLRLAELGAKNTPRFNVC